MDLLNNTSIAALVFFAGVFLMICGVIIAPFLWYYLYHRRRMAEIKGTHAQHIGSLNERIDRLEKKCAEMQEKITDAHLLIADEQRQLDKKLSQSFPDIITPMPPIPEEPSKSAARRANRERSRE